MILISAFVAAVFLYSLVSRRVERTWLTAPILFVAAGSILEISREVSGGLDLDRTNFLIVAELGLVMLLFTDASRIRLRMLRERPNLAVRLLSVGMLATIALGAVVAKALFADLTWWEAGIVAAILAPTDAGLGQVIVNSPLVPERIRQALNVEAGLNDGLSVPFLMLFIALAASAAEGASGGAVLTRLLVEQLGYGALVGVGIGLGGGWLLALARRNTWMAESTAQLGVVALPLACALASHATGASMFIAAFVAGLAAQWGFPDIGRHSVEFTEEWGQLLNDFVFFLFGVLVVQPWADFGWPVVLYGVLSLTLIRMLPVALALRGTGLAGPTLLFMGWFGPRGLASIVLGLVYLEHESQLAGESTIRLAVMATVLLSILAHGLSAQPGIRRYAAAIASLPPGAPEHQVPATATDARGTSHHRSP
ncbi:MAG: cation:proton antiporter [Betaproteobacteria bacterium]|nr:cation:proton antiporter [Betaproteobacteria bacterium]